MSKYEPTIAEVLDRKFGVIIDEVHSSQSGESSKHLKKSLSDTSLDEFQEGEGRKLDASALCGPG